MSDSTIQHTEYSLAGRRIAFVGKLASMSRREAEQLVRDRGARVMDRAGADADLIIVSDEAGDLKRLASDRALFDDHTREALSAGLVEFMHESDLWGQLGLVDSAHGIERLYTPAMLAELVGVPINAIRQWQRRGALVPKQEVRRLAYFDFEEVRVAQKLAALIEAGCSLATVNRRLQELSRLLPESERPLLDPAVVVEGRRLLVKREEGLAEPSGQLLIDFDVAQPKSIDESELDEPVAIPFNAAETLLNRSTARPRGPHPYAAEDVRCLAAELAESGQPAQAIEAYRALLFSGESTAEDHFDLAELLYQTGDLSAARERYYVAIELDEDFVEARSNLGCVLDEHGEQALAEAAFRGALEYHPDYADAHYHLAKLLDRMDRSDEASRHWHLFMNLAPASPWADEARERIAGDGFRLSALGQIRAEPVTARLTADS